MRYRHSERLAGGTMCDVVPKAAGFPRLTGADRYSDRCAVRLTGADKHPLLSTCQPLSENSSVFPPISARVARPRRGIFRPDCFFFHPGVIQRFDTTAYHC